MITTENGYSLARWVKDKAKNEFKFEDVMNIGVHIIDLLEVIHESGYIFNDICPEKIHLGLNQRLKFCTWTTEVKGAPDGVLNL